MVELCLEAAVAPFGRVVHLVVQGSLENAAQAVVADVLPVDLHGAVVWDSFEADAARAGRCHGYGEGGGGRGGGGW